jgi:uncharacterized protein YbaA (DUF1428 family)
MTLPAVAQDPIAPDALLPGAKDPTPGIFLIDKSNVIHVEPFYELRIYTANPGKLEALNARFRDHTTALFERHGMTNVGYWTPIESDNDRLIYLLRYPDRETRDASWKAFMADPDWQAAYKASTAEGKLVASVESIFLGTTDWSPELDLEAEAKLNGERLFEMRDYTTVKGKLPELHRRFQKHTIDLFEKHGIRNLPYFAQLGKTEEDPIDEDTLLYFVVHEDEASRAAGFKAFGADPEWQAARDASEANGKLLVEKGVKSTLLRATDYSPLR